MLRKNYWHILIFLLTLMLGSWGLAQEPPPENAKKKPSLAQLAKQTRAKRANSAKPTRTITNADLPSLDAKLSQGSFPEESQPAEASTEKAEDPENPDAEPAEDAVTEDDPFAVNDAFDESLSGEVLDETDLTPEQSAAWQDAFREARLQYQNAVNEALVLQLRVNNLENSYFAQSDGSLQERLGSDLDQTMKAITTNKQSQSEAKAALEALRANAAAAGLSKKQIDKMVGKLPAVPPEIEIREPEPDPNEPPSP